MKKFYLIIITLLLSSVLLKVKVFNSAMVPVLDKGNLDRGFYYVIINDEIVKKLIVK
jgi:hypothetical protein